MITSPVAPVPIYDDEDIIPGPMGSGPGAGSMAIARGRQMSISQPNTLRQKLLTEPSGTSPNNRTAAGAYGRNNQHSVSPSHAAVEPSPYNNNNNHGGGYEMGAAPQRPPPTATSLSARPSAAESVLIISSRQQHEQQAQLPPPQQSQLPQQTVREIAPDTPWTLGSTDSSYAINMVLQEKRIQLSALIQNNRRVCPSPNQQDTEKLAVDMAECNEDVDWKLIALQNNQSLLQDHLFHQPSAAVEATLAAACEVMAFDIAEMWLRTGLKTHQLTNSHLRPTSLDESTRNDLVDVYYGEKSAERTHRLSPALCKRAKEANDVIWVSAQSERDAEALRCSISNVRTAVAVPICHQASNTNITIIFFSVRRVVVRPSSVEFLVHMALAAGVASANPLEDMGHSDRKKHERRHKDGEPLLSPSRSDHGPHDHYTSVTGEPLDLHWRQLQNVEYLTDGGSSWIHTAVLQGRPVVVKTLKPECQDTAVAINEIESELAVHSRLDHGNIVRLFGAGTTSKNIRFLVLERLDGGTLSQMLGYDTRIRDRRRRFWKRKHFSFIDILRIARSIAKAMVYCHEEALPGCIVIHRDLKPDNIGFTLDGTVKVLDFGLAKIIENGSVNSKDVYSMTGETGSLRYMAPEVAEGTPYNAAVDVYSFGIMLWELNAGKKPFEGLTREAFYEQVVHGGERPPIRSKWPEPLCNLMTRCWDANMWNRPTFRQILERLDAMLNKEMGGGGSGGPLRRGSNSSSSSGDNKKPLVRKLTGMIDRHSTWF